jgi:hypothetical protein
MGIEVCARGMRQVRVHVQRFRRGDALEDGENSGTSYFHPHVEADRLYFDAMVAGDYQFWRKTTLQDIEEHGHQETLNWLLMLGAMAELGGRKPQEARFVESWLTNANKVFAVFRP